MTVPCVRVEREAGEETRQALAERDIIDGAHEIVHEDGFLYIPVTDPGAVPDEYEVVDREAPARETQTMPAELVEFDVSYERIGSAEATMASARSRARSGSSSSTMTTPPIRS